MTPTTITVSSSSVADLVAAINTANTNGQDSNTIDLSGTYDITAIDNYWYGPNGLPAITSNLTIEGDPTDGAIIERSSVVSTPAFRLFYVAAAQSGLTQGTLTLENVTLGNGLAQGGSSNLGGGGLGAGGAIFNMGSLTLNGVTTARAALAGGWCCSSGRFQQRGSGGGGIGSNAPTAIGQNGNGGGFGGSAPGAEGGAGAEATSNSRRWRRLHHDSQRERTERRGYRQPRRSGS